MLISFDIAILWLSTVLRTTYSMYSVSFWVHFLILVWFNFKFAKSINKRPIEGRVIHGKNASIREHAHAVRIQIIKTDLSSHTCGSSVLNQRFLLTAAHCVLIKENFTTVAFAGHEDIRKSPVSRIALTTIIHRNYKVTRTVKNDIALVFLKQDLPLGTNIKRIIMKKKFPSGVTGTLAGWGIINEVTLEGTELLKLLTQKVYGKNCGFMHIARGMFCAGSMNSSNPSPSLGDSGSGLITNKFQIIGILSYKINEYPALPVYTNVSYFYPWIEKTILRICNRNITKTNSKIIKIY